MNDVPFRSPTLISRENSQLVLIDLQERLLPVMFESDRILANARRLAEAARQLQVPVVATEQYPAGLGATVAELAGCADRMVEKTRFSAADAFVVNEDAPSQLVLCGIEAHVCVLQTALDLLGLGANVFIVADAVSSRSETSRQLAIERLRDNGASVVTAESVLFEWLESSEHPRFKAVQQLIK